MCHTPLGEVREHAVHYTTEVVKDRNHYRITVDAQGRLIRKELNGWDDQ